MSEADMGPHEHSKAREALRRWARLKAVFFKAPAPPRAAETEAFVARVMDRVRAEREAGSGWRALLRPRWLLPAAGAGALALMLAVAVPAPEAPDLLLLDEAGLAEPALAEDSGDFAALLAEESR